MIRLYPFSTLLLKKILDYYCSVPIKYQFFLFLSSLKFFVFVKLKIYWVYWLIKGKIKFVTFDFLFRITANISISLSTTSESVISILKLYSCRSHVCFLKFGIYLFCCFCKWGSFIHLFSNGFYWHVFRPLFSICEFCI